MSNSQAQEGEKVKKAPIGPIMPQVRNMPFYQLVNDLSVWLSPEAPSITSNTETWQKIGSSSAKEV